MKVILMITLFMINAVLNVLSLDVENNRSIQQRPVKASQRYIDPFNEKQTDEAKE